MRWGLLLVPVALLVTSCGMDPSDGERYMAERALWRANREFQSLSIRPQDVREDQWKALAQRYEAIADRFGRPSQSAEKGTAREETQTLAAVALFTAARVHAALHDSTGMEMIYERMACDFEHQPEVAAEVALARGSLAEREGDRARAAEFYQAVVDRVAPEPDAPGIAGMVLELPLRIARLQAGNSPSSADPQAYAAARAYYDRLVTGGSSDLVRADAQARLAEVHTDLGEWRQAIRVLRDLEPRLRTLDKPPREPAMARIGIYNVQRRAGVDPDSIRINLQSILTDYPDSRMGWQALMALAVNANERNQVDEAVGYLDRIVNEKMTNEEAMAQVLLSKGRLLESRGRWPQALEALRSLSAEHLVSEAGLTAPLEIASHYRRIGDDEALKAALAQAEQQYRDFISGYPDTPYSALAREQLAQTLALQKNYGGAVDELVNLGEKLNGTPRGGVLLVQAAGMAARELADTARAATILDRVHELYANESVGSWAASEASRLRGLATK